jgi:hypothetical protein
MPVFPTRESEIRSLVQQMLGGYEKHPGDFPHVARHRLLIGNLIYQTIVRQQQQRLATWRKMKAARAKSFAELKRVMKECLRKSQVDVADQPQKLHYIGWGPRRKAKALAAPAAPQDLRSRITAAAAVTLTWQPPAAAPGTGPVQNYLIERRELLPQQVPGPWRLLTTTYQTTITLAGQPRRIELQYRVRTTNAAGVSRPGNLAGGVL